MCVDMLTCYRTCFSGNELNYFSINNIFFHRTPLMAASCEGTPKMVRLLLEYGADPSLRDNHKQTAANYALQNQSELYGYILFYILQPFFIINFALDSIISRVRDNHSYFSIAFWHLTYLCFLYTFAMLALYFYFRMSNILKEAVGQRKYLSLASNEGG